MIYHARATYVWASVAAEHAHHAHVLVLIMLICGWNDNNNNAIQISDRSTYVLYSIGSLAWRAMGI